MPHLNRLIAEMEKACLDALIISDEVHQRYLTGLALEDALLLITRNDAYLLTDFRYMEAAKAVCSNEFHIETPSFGHLGFILEVLRDKGISRAALEEDHLTLSAFDRYTEKLPGIELVGGASAILKRLRLQKTPEEIATIAKAQSITDAAFSHILTFIRPGVTETEVALELDYFMRKSGAEGSAFETIAVSGSASSRPHGVPRNLPLEKGFLTMDFGAKLDGYCSDMTRTVVIGTADQEMKRLYNTVLAAQLAALDAAKEGISCRDLDGVARKIINDAGYQGAFGHALGHGVGVRIHEEPRLSPAAPLDLVLHCGNVVTFEPGIYLNGKYGCRIEDMGVILENGALLNFTHSPKELFEL